MRACLAVAMAVAMLLRVAADELVVAPSPAAADSEHEQPARPRTPQPTAQANTGADADDADTPTRAELADTPTRLHGAELAADDDVEGEVFPAAWTTLTDKQLTVGAGEEDVARFNEDSRAKGLQRNVIDGVLTAEQCTWLSRAFDDAKGAQGNGSWFMEQDGGVQNTRGAFNDEITVNTGTVEEGGFRPPLMEELEARVADIAHATFGAQVSKTRSLVTISRSRIYNEPFMPVHADQCNLATASSNENCDGLHDHKGLFGKDADRESLLTSTISFGLRAYTGIVYVSDLNVSDGGELMFAQPFAHGESAPLTHAVRPRCGRLALFRSDHGSPHGVMEFHGSERMAIQIWMRNKTQHVVRLPHSESVDKVATIQANLEAAGEKLLNERTAAMLVAYHGTDLDAAIYHAVRMQRSPDIFDVQGATLPPPKDCPDILKLPILDVGKACQNSAVTYSLLGCSVECQNATTHLIRELILVDEVTFSDCLREHPKDNKELARAKEQVGVVFEHCDLTGEQEHLNKGDHELR